MIVWGGRLAGAILLQGDDQFLLVGNTKEPCDWARAGFAVPPDSLSGQTRVVALSPVRTVQVERPCLVFDWNGGTTQSLAELLANRLLIQRNGSVSERLWRLVTGENEERSQPLPDELDASWLVAMPEAVWTIVRETVLKCL